MNTGSLTLENRQIFTGKLLCAPSEQVFGEVVFNTGMTGYVESLTDPSYSGQILVFTYPLIGNYGVLGTESWESDRVHVSGVVVSEACRDWSHDRGMNSLLEWLREQGVPVL